MPVATPWEMEYRQTSPWFSWAGAGFTHLVVKSIECQRMRRMTSDHKSSILGPRMTNGSRKLIQSYPGQTCKLNVLHIYLYSVWYQGSIFHHYMECLGVDSCDPITREALCCPPGVVTWPLSRFFTSSRSTSRTSQVKVMISDLQSVSVQVGVCSERLPTGLWRVLRGLLAVGTD